MEPTTSTLVAAGDAEQASDNQGQVEAEELIALIKAIKFAYEEYGCKRVHDEIKTHGGKYARVPLKRVKKYMQKLGMTNVQEDASKAHVPEAVPAGAADAHSTPPVSGKKSNSKHAKDAKATIQLMTVGGQSKSQRPGAETDAAGVSADGEADKWLPVKLDEPATKMSKFPYQAVIRMTDSEEGDASGAMGEIYKIQVAMEADGSLSDVHPMLVYNKARSRKTFLHPESPAYHPVQRLIKARGFNGAVGGAKAYFWGRYRQDDDMLYVNTEKLAPFQKW